MSSVSSLKDERAIIFPFLSSTRLLLSLSLSLRFFSRSKNEIFAGRSGRKSWESSKRDARDNQLGVRGGNALEKSSQRIYPAVN